MNNVAIKIHIEVFTLAILMRKGKRKRIEVMKEKRRGRGKRKKGGFECGEGGWQKIRLEISVLQSSRVSP